MKYKMQIEMKSIIEIENTYIITRKNYNLMKFY